jgi:hypothetical protein
MKFCTVRFSQFNESKFPLNHFITIVKTRFKFVPSILLVGLLTITLVSFANKVVWGSALLFWYFIIKGRPLIYKRKSNGPRKDPWVTLWFWIVNGTQLFWQVLCGFLQSLQTNAWIVLQLFCDDFLPSSFHLIYHLCINCCICCNTVP